jgi:hypothetical protein
MTGPSQGKGRLQIAVGLKSELPFEIVLGEPRGSGVIRGITERALLADFVAKVPKCRAINFPQLDEP